MKRSALVISTLVVALLGSNAWWLYNAIDAGITASYRDQVLDEQREALDELLEVIPVAASSAGSKQAILQAARKISPGAVEFEKDGFVWLGSLGYRFDEHNILLEVKTNP